MVFQGKSQIRIGFAVIGIGMHAGQPLQRFGEMLFSLFEKPFAHKQDTIGIVQADIPFIPFQTFQVIGFRQIGSMAILLDMLGCYI